LGNKKYPQKENFTATNLETDRIVLIQMGAKPLNPTNKKIQGTLVTDVRTSNLMLSRFRISYAYSNSSLLESNPVKRVSRPPRRQWGQTRLQRTHTTRPHRFNGMDIDGVVNYLSDGVLTALDEICEGVHR